jgi:hypothetical protein
VSDWRSRAEPVKDDWRSRAEPVEPASTPAILQGTPPEEIARRAEAAHQEEQAQQAPAKPESKTSLMGYLDAASRGLRRGATLGWGDEFEAAGDWIDSKLGFSPPRATGPGLDAPVASSFQDFHKLVQEREQKAQQDAPTTYAAGQGAGSAFPALLPVGQVAQGATIPAKIAAGVGSGGMYGGIAAAGESEADTVEGRADDAVEGAMWGAGAGGAVPAVGGAVGRTGQRMIERGKSMQKSADPIRVHAAGGDTRALRQVADKRGGIEGFAESIREYGIKNADDVARVKKEGLSQIDDVAREVTGSGVKVDGNQVAQRIDALIEEQARGPSGQRIRRALQSEADAFREVGQMDFEELLRERRALGKTLKPGSENPLATQKDRLYGILSEELDRAADFMQEGTAAQWRAANRKYEVARTLEQAIKRTDTRQATNRRISLTDYLGGIGGVAGMAAGGPAGGVGGAAAGIAVNKLVRGNEDAFVAGALEKGGRALMSGGQRLAGAGQVFGGAGIRRAAGQRAGTIRAHIADVAVTHPERLGPFAEPMLTALEENGADGVAVKHEILQHDPEYQKVLRQIEEEDFADE